MRPDTASAIRAQLIAAIEQRAAGLDGEARRLLDTRLAELRAHDDESPDAAPADATTPRPNPLHELVAHLAREAAPAYPHLPALADFRQLWSTLRADNQLRQSVAHTPTDAGPLNSTALATRAIALMRDLSPDYLRSFLAYIDDLAWLEQLNGTGSTAAAGPTATKKRARRKQQA